MSKKRQYIEIERFSGSILTPVRWVVLLGIVASIWMSFGLAVNRPAVLATAAAYALAVAGLPSMCGRPLTLYAVQRLMLAADLLFSAAVFHFSGGIHSPYFGLWYLVLIHAALLLGPRVGLGIAAAAAFLVVASEWTRTGTYRALWDLDLALGKLPFLLLIAWTAGRLGQELRDREATRREAERRALTLEAEETRLRQEMEIARRVQESLLPIATPDVPGFSIAALSYPAREVGGDTYELIELPEGWNTPLEVEHPPRRKGGACGGTLSEHAKAASSGGPYPSSRLLIAIADVSGKGVPAALLTVAVQQAIRLCAGPEPAEVLAGVNRLLIEKLPEEMFVTAACVVVDTRDGSVAAATAGHPAPLWWDHNRQSLTPVGGCAPALGLLENWSGPTRRWRLSPGDALLLYTDGVLDAKLGARERLGEERLVEMLARGTLEDAGAWLERLRRGLETCPEWPDDVTAVAVSRAPLLRRVELPSCVNRILTGS